MASHTPRGGGLGISRVPPGTVVPGGDQPLWSHVHDDAVIAQFELVDYDEMSVRYNTATVLSMLHQLHALLDRLTDKYELYKVEAHAGRLSVAANVSTRVDRPAERVLCCACEFIVSAQDVGLATVGQRLAFRAALNAGTVCSAVLGTSALRYGIYGPCEVVCRRLVGRSVINQVLAPEAFVRLLSSYIEERLWERLGTLRLAGMHETITGYLLDPTNRELASMRANRGGGEGEGVCASLARREERSRAGLEHGQLEGSQPEANVDGAEQGEGTRAPPPPVGFSLVFSDPDTEKQFRLFQGVRMTSMDALHLVASLMLIQTVAVRSFAQNEVFAQTGYASLSTFTVLVAAVLVTVVPLIAMIISHKSYLELRTLFMGTFRLVRIYCLVSHTCLMPGALIENCQSTDTLTGNTLLMNSIVHALHAIGAQIVLQWHLVVQSLALGAVGFNNYRACYLEGAGLQECSRKDVMGTFALQVMILLVIPTVLVWRVERWQRRSFVRWSSRVNSAKRTLSRKSQVGIVERDRQPGHLVTSAWDYFCCAQLLSL